MDSENLQIVEIVDVNDDILLPWLDLYETAFPPPERLLVSAELQLLKQRAAGEEVPVHMLAALNEEGMLVGMLQYEVVEEVAGAFLWYFAVQPVERNRGLGAWLYRELWNRLDAVGCSRLVFEVEIPDLSESVEGRRLAERRIAFYRRQGAQLMHGINHMQEVGWHQAPTPMHVMIDARPPVDAQTAYDVADVVLQGTISQVGALGLS